MISALDMAGIILPTAYDRLIFEITTSKLRSFLHELAEGTSNYHSLHSLTEQVEHQYHCRFLVELIQNAHDALLPRDPRSEGVRVLKSN
jgi:hypothetical protein